MAVAACQNVALTDAYFEPLAARQVVKHAASSDIQTAKND